MKRTGILAALLLFTLSAFCVSVKSPDRKIVFSIEKEKGGFFYSLKFKDKEFIAPSMLGLADNAGNVCPSAAWKIEKVSRAKVKDVWKPVWGKRAVVPDVYNSLSVLLSDGKGNKMTVEVRVYNDGAAFRYATDDRQQLKEITEFRFADDYKAWFYNGERHNIGPEKVSESDGERWPVMTLDATLVEYEPCFMAIHEADLCSNEPLKLTTKKGERRFCVNQASQVYEDGMTAWRVIMCSDEIGTLVDSHIIELLNPASEMDFSWVRPGVALWDWRIDGAEWEGFKYTMSYPSWVRMVDFAERQGFQHLVLDANWYGPEFEKTSDPVMSENAKNVKNLIEYAKGKGVGIWLYLNDVGGTHYPIEATLKQYGEWGAAGVKYGFMNGSLQEKNRKTRHITEECAKNKLLVDFHDYPVHPYGQMRTWPNAVTREYCKAQLDGHDIFYPKTFVTSVYVNMLAGPLDMNNGMFDLPQGRTTRVDNNQEVPTTLAAEAARTQIVFSGATVIPDIPEYYEKYPSLLRFLSAEKQPWKESKTLLGEIGEYIVMMRQAADGNYLIGAATNEWPRDVVIPLDFLPKGTFTAEITEDGTDAHYLHNHASIRTKTQTVKSEDILTLRLAPGGGACVLITSKK